MSGNFADCMLTAEAAPLRMGAAVTRLALGSIPQRNDITLERHRQISDALLADATHMAAALPNVRYHELFQKIKERGERTISLADRMRSFFPFSSISEAMSLASMRLHAILGQADRDQPVMAAAVAAVAQLPCVS